MNNAVYVLDDHFEIPEYVKNRSSEERKKWIAILEKQAISSISYLVEKTTLPVIIVDSILLEGI